MGGGSDASCAMVDSENGLDMPSIIRILGEHSQGSLRARGANAAFLFGPTGAGKSLTMNYLLEKRIFTSTETIYEEGGCDPVDVEERLTVESPLVGCTVGHSADSQTRILAGHDDPKTGLIFVDTPGFEDTEGSVVDIVRPPPFHCMQRLVRPGHDDAYACSHAERPLSDLM